METSQLQNTSMVSDFNLLDDVVVEENEEVEIAKTEAELKRMGEQTGCGLSYICEDLEQMLDGPGNTSTPKLSTTSNSMRSSMPPLVSVSSSPNPILSSNSGMPGSDYQIGSPTVVFSPPPSSVVASPVYSPYVSPTYSPLTRSLQAITPKDVVIQNEKIGNYVNFTCLTKKITQATKGKRD